MEEYLKYLYNIYKKAYKLFGIKPKLKYKDLQQAYRGISKLSDIGIEECYFEENGKYVVKYLTKKQVLEWKN